MAVMTRALAILLSLAAALAAALPAAESPAQRLAKWHPVEMPFRSAGLSAQERQLVEKLVDACRSLDEVYWRQSDLAGRDLLRATKDPAIQRLLIIMGSRWDLIDENRPFTGAEPMPPGHELYPRNLTRDQIEDYVARHPADKAAIYDPYTVVKRQGDRLIGVPYHVEYKPLLDSMATALRAAAALSADARFASFLRLRADALLTDQWCGEPASGRLGPLQIKSSSLPRVVRAKLCGSIRHPARPPRPAGTARKTHRLRRQSPAGEGPPCPH